MRSCAQASSCCERWSEILAAYKEGRQLEAAREAARMLRAGEGRFCRLRALTVKLMHVEGFIGDDEIALLARNDGRVVH